MLMIRWRQRVRATTTIALSELGVISLARYTTRYLTYVCANKMCKRGQNDGESSGQDYVKNLDSLFLLRSSLYLWLSKRVRARTHACRRRGVIRDSFACVLKRGENLCRVTRPSQERVFREPLLSGAPPATFRWIFRGAPWFATDARNFIFHKSRHARALRLTSPRHASNRLAPPATKFTSQDAPSTCRLPTRIFQNARGLSLNFMKRDQLLLPWGGEARRECAEKTYQRAAERKAESGYGPE